MRHVSARRVLGIVAVTAMAVPFAAPIASAKPASAHSNLVKAVTKADAQAKKLIVKSRSCPSAARQRAITIKVRGAQTRNLKKASPTSLRLRQMRISVHAQRLAVALSKCSSSGSGSPATPGSPGSGERGLQGADGFNGSRIAGIPLDSVDETLNAASILSGVPLPALIPVVDLPGLDTIPCLASGAVCLGVDRDGIVDMLTAAVRERGQDLPVLKGVLDPLLDQVDRAFESSDVSSLIDVERTGDTTFVVTAAPGSALERLINLLENTGGLPSGSLGTLQARP